jgi:hypothetical protein
MIQGFGACAAARSRPVWRSPESRAEQLVMTTRFDALAHDAEQDEAGEVNRLFEAGAI